MARRESANETYEWGNSHLPNDFVCSNTINNDKASLEHTLYHVTDHDVLSGRGVNIAQHAGNERFRALVNARHDANYCHSYSAAEKRAVAEEIISYIKALDPPGRFLRRNGRSNRSARGLEGPWEELPREEEIKKTCQALRDSNRQDRTGYAAAVPVPQDVRFSESLRLQSGMTNKQLAEIAAAQAKLHADSEQQHMAATTAILSSESKRPRGGETDDVDPMEPTPIRSGPIQCTTECTSNPWMVKKPRLDPTPSHVTPATAASSVGLNSSAELFSEGEPSVHHHAVQSDQLLLHQQHHAPEPNRLLDLLHDQHQQYMLGYSQAVDGAEDALLEPNDLHHNFADEAAALQAHFQSDDGDDEDGKPLALSLSDHDRSTGLVADPLRFAREADMDDHDLPLLSSTGGIDAGDFGPPSPLHHHHTDHRGQLQDDVPF